MKMLFQAVAIIVANFQIFIVIVLLMILKYELYCSFFYNNFIISDVYKPVIKTLLLVVLAYVVQNWIEKERKEKLTRTGLVAFDIKVFS